MNSRGTKTVNWLPVLVQEGVVAWVKLARRHLGMVFRLSKGEE